jgi:hypothetical protein
LICHSHSPHTLLPVPTHTVGSHSRAGTPSVSSGHHAFVVARAPAGLPCSSQAPTPSFTTSRHLLSTPQMSLFRPRLQTPSQRGFFRSHLLVICALQTLATRQPLHVSIAESSPRACPTPAQVSCPRCTRHERCSFANGRPPSKAAWIHFAASIIQARRCRRVTMRSGSLVSASSSERALASCPDVKAEGDTHVHRCLGLHECRLQRYCQGMMCSEE